jgi:hypothetical protein
MQKNDRQTLVKKMKKEKKSTFYLKLPPLFLNLLPALETNRCLDTRLNFFPSPASVHLLL